MDVEPEAAVGQLEPILPREIEHAEVIDVDPARRARVAAGGGEHAGRLLGRRPLDLLRHVDRGDPEVAVHARAHVRRAQAAGHRNQRRALRAVGVLHRGVVGVQRPRPELGVGAGERGRRPGRRHPPDRRDPVDLGGADGVDELAPEHERRALRAEPVAERPDVVLAASRGPRLVALAAGLAHARVEREPAAGELDAQVAEEPPHRARTRDGRAVLHQRRRVVTELAKQEARQREAKVEIARARRRARVVRHLARARAVRRLGGTRVARGGDRAGAVREPARARGPRGRGVGGLALVGRAPRRRAGGGVRRGWSVVRAGDARPREREHHRTEPERGHLHSVCTPNWVAGIHAVGLWHRPHSSSVR